MKKIILCLVVICSLLLMACPKEDVVRKAAKASYSLSGLTADVAVAAQKAYHDGLIDVHSKDRIAVWLKQISKGGKQFTALTEAAHKSQVADAGTINSLNLILSTEITAPFLEILQELKILSKDASDFLQTAIAALRSAILVISSALSTTKVIASNRFIKNNRFAGVVEMRFIYA